MNVHFEGERPSWPGGARCAVMLSFDVDGPAAYVNLDPRATRRPVVFSLAAYGTTRGVPRILDVLAEFEVPATFYVPGWTAEKWPEMTAAIVAGGHELGHHGYLHETDPELTVDEMRAIVERSQEVFTRLAGSPAVGFRSGWFPDEAPRLLRELGFTYSSSMRGDDFPYRWDVAGGAGDLIEIPAKWELDDFPHFGYHSAPREPSGGDRVGGLDWAARNWLREFEGYHRCGGCYPLMMHPEVTGHPSRITVLRRVLEHIRRRDDVWFATGAEIAQWWSERY